MAGADPTGLKPNAFIEANGAARETIERAFRLTPRTIGLFAVFGVFVPALIYRGAVRDFVRARREATRGERARGRRARGGDARALRATRRTGEGSNEPKSNRPTTDDDDDDRRTRTTIGTDDRGKSSCSARGAAREAREARRGRLGCILARRG